MTKRQRKFDKKVKNNGCVDNRDGFTREPKLHIIEMQRSFALSKSKREVFLMATKSITKNVVIRSKPLARNFVRALENAEGKSSTNVVVDKTVHEIKGDALREMFGKK